MRTLLLTLVMSLAACGSDEPFEDCNLGDIDGAWRVSYSEDDGTCGPLADETVIFGSDAGGAGDCTGDTDISADQCEATLDVFCTDGSTYEQHNVWVLTQTGEETIGGIVTIQYEEANFACRSTYDVLWRRQ